MILHAWKMIFYAWKMILCTWKMIFDAWKMILDAWKMILCVYRMIFHPRKMTFDTYKMILYGGWHFHSGAMSPRLRGQVFLARMSSRVGKPKTCSREREAWHPNGNATRLLGSWFV